MILSSQKPSALAFDPGTLRFRTFHAKNGERIVNATLFSHDGQPLFTTAGTDWNLHGSEQFENGTSLYLHHRDHPTSEQRIIIWPPDTGTFDTFAESKSLRALANELKRRSARLAAKPAKTIEPSAAYFRAIVPRYSLPKPDPLAKIMAGGREDEPNFDRYEFRLVSNRTENGREVMNPCLADLLGEEILFNLTETAWDASFERQESRIDVTLRYPDRGNGTFRLHIDLYGPSARIDEDEMDLPLAFVERHLRNYALYESWDTMVAALRAGPVARKRPDLVLTLPRGVRAELWAGEPRLPLPFLQPCFVGADGHPLLDFRETCWAAAVTADQTQPRITLRFVSDEKKNRSLDPRFDLQLDFRSRQVTCRGFKGSTTIGMIQAMIRHVRGTKWLKEDLATWFAKGRDLGGTG